MRRSRSRSRNKQINKNCTYIFIIFFILIIVALFLIKYFNTKDNINTSIPISEIEENTIDNSIEEKQDIPKDVGVSLAVVGNIKLDNDILTDSFNSKTNSYDFSHIFNNINRYLKYVDITIGTLEYNISNKNFSSFVYPQELITSLSNLGFDILSTCSNTNSPLISNTIDEIKKSEIINIGTYKTKDESNDILIKNIEGFKIAFLAYTTETKHSSNYYINKIDKDLIKEQINIAKNKNADIICVNLNWGQLNDKSPSKEQKDITNFLFENGVDIILGSHPNSVQPMEIRKIKLENGKTKNGFVIYSLGNFINEKNTSSIILTIKLTKHIDKTITIDSIKYIPIYTYKNENKKSLKYEILDINKLIVEYINESDKAINKDLYKTLSDVNKKLKNILEN